MSWFFLAALGFLAPPDPSSGDGEPGGNWPQFRGERALGVADDQTYPTTWNVETGENIRWRTTIPGLSYSSPVIWGDRLFVTTAVRRGGMSEVKVGLYGSPNPVGEEGVHKFQTFCLDRDTGDVIWVRTGVECEPDTQRHPKGSFAAPTPVTDGEFLAAFFGSEGLFVYDLDGQEIWAHDFGVLDAGWYVAPDAQFGYASSPVIHEGMLFVQCDVQESPFIAAMDLATGEEIWRVAREEVPTWSTPTVDVAHGRDQLIVNGWKHMGAYDLFTGEELWKLSGGGDVPVPTPIVGFEKVYITNGHGRWNPIYCIDVGAEGEIENAFDAASEPYVVWSQRSRGTYMQTPILYGDLLFACNDSGVVLCVDPITGRNIDRQRLGTGGSGFTASPVAADGQLYFTGEYGDIHVIEATEAMTPVAMNPMGEVCMATPALSNGEIYIRTRTSIVAIADGAQGGTLAQAATDEPVVEEAGASDLIEWLDAGDLPEPSALFEKHLAARGGREAMGAVTSVTIQGDWELTGIGLTGETFSQYRAPDRYVSETDIQGMGLTRQGYDGETAWIMHPSVGNTRLEGPVGASIRELAHWAPELVQFENIKVERTAGQCRFDDRVCYAVDCFGTDGGTRLYFDAGTGLLAGRDTHSATLSGLMRVVTTYRAWEEFEGILFATEVESDYPDEEFAEITRITDVSFEELDAELFDVPDEVTGAGR